MLGWTWTSVKGGVEACRFLNKLFHEYYQGLAHILRKGGTFFLSSLNIYYHMYLQAIGQIPRGESHRLQNNQPKNKRKYFHIFLASARD